MKKKPWSLILGMLMLGCATLLLLPGCNRQKAAQGSKSNQTVAAPKFEIPVPAPAPLPKATTAKDAIANGIAFLERSKWAMEYTYMYTYLQPRFSWPSISAQMATYYVKDSLSRVGDAAAMGILQEMEYFKRLVEPSFKLAADQMAQARELDAVTLPSLYCDDYQIDTAAYFPILRNELANPGYRSTHALLCYHWMLERGCFSVAQLSSLRGKMVDTNRELILRFPSWSDLTLESAALLQAIGEPILEAWIEGVVAAQLQDGGWSAVPNGGTSDTHATIFALWLLAGHR